MLVDRHPVEAVVMLRFLNDRRRSNAHDISSILNTVDYTAGCVDGWPKASSGPSGCVDTVVTPHAVKAF